MWMNDIWNDISTNYLSITWTFEQKWVFIQIKWVIYLYAIELCEKLVTSFSIIHFIDILSQTLKMALNKKRWTILWTQWPGIMS